MKIAQIVYWRTKWLGQTIYWRTKWLGQTIYWRTKWLVRKFYTPRQIRDLTQFSKNWSLFTSGENPSALLECIDVFDRMVTAAQIPLDSHPLNCGFTLRIDFPDSHKPKTVEEEFETAPGYKIGVTRRDFTLQAVGSRLIEEISSRDGKNYIFRSRLKLLKDAVIRPSTWKPSLTRSFVVSINQTSNYPTTSFVPLLTQFRLHEGLDYWSRTAVSASSDENSPRVNSLSIALLAQKATLKHPVVQLINSDFRSFIDFLAITSNRTVAKSLLEPLQNTIFVQAIDLIARENSETYPNERLNQVMLKDSGSDLHPIYSHSDFSFDNVSILNNVEIWHERFVVKNNRVICREDAADLRADWPAGLWMYKWAHSTIANGVLITEPTKSEHTIDKAIAGFGRCDANWFHFNIETLPRILNASRVTDNGVPVLVQSDIPQSAVDAIIATTG